MTLRKHYKGAVTVFLEEEHPPELVEGLREAFDVDVNYRPDVGINVGTLVHKIEISQDTPYDVTVWLDSDTVILGEFSELFDLAEDCDLAIPHFAGWKTTGRTIKGRIKRYKDFVPEYMDAAINYGPAINTGIYAWRKDTPIFEEWMKVASWGDKKMFIADEVACQVLLPQYNCKIAPIKYNVSVLHDPNTPDPRIIHYHGKKHVKNAPKCAIWMEAFHEAIVGNVCGIEQYVDRKYGDKRLTNFLKGKYSSDHEGWRKKIIAALETTRKGSQASKKGKKGTPKALKGPEIIIPKLSKVDTTIVTGCDGKYVEHLAATLPNWIKYKGLDQYPMIVYTNGFGSRRRDHRLDFLRSMPNVKLISWNLEVAEDQRENMLSAFVLGAAKNVDTKYWLKVDADAYAVNDVPLITDKMKEYSLCGHKWGYSFAKHIKPLVEWSNSHPAFADLPKDVYDLSRVDGRRYNHARIASYVCLHDSEFVQMAASLCPDRLPVPSHDTYLWYVAERMGIPYLRHNFKRKSGMTNKSSIGSLRTKLAELEGEQK
jgi:hypothetical protein